MHAAAAIATVYLVLLWSPGLKSFFRTRILTDRYEGDRDHSRCRTGNTDGPSCRREKQEAGSLQAIQELAELLF